MWYQRVPTSTKTFDFSPRAMMGKLIFDTVIKSSVFCDFRNYVQSSASVIISKSFKKGRENNDTIFFYNVFTKLSTLP
jgi:hypothetical protein